MSIILTWIFYKLYIKLHCRMHKPLYNLHSLIKRKKLNRIKTQKKQAIIFAEKLEHPKKTAYRHKKPYLL